MTTDQAIIHPSAQQDERGRFVKGNQLGKAVNKYAKPPSLATLKKRMRQAVTPKDIYNITRAIVRKASSGDIQAAALIYDRIFGKAPQNVDVSHTHNAGEAVILQQIAVILDRQPDLRAMLAADGTQVVDAGDGDRGTTPVISESDSDESDPPAPPSEDADAV